jgi:hypothetical protein
MEEFLNSKRIEWRPLYEIRSQGGTLDEKNKFKFAVSNKITQRSLWKLRSSPFDFQSWLISQSCFTLCFDGASKGNPLYGPRGKWEV